MGIKCQGERAAALQEQRQAQTHLQARHCHGGLGKPPVVNETCSVPLPYSV